MDITRERTRVSMRVMKMFYGDPILKIMQNININGVGVNELCNWHSGQYPHAHRMLIFYEPVTNAPENGHRFSISCLHACTFTLDTFTGDYEE